MIYATNEKREHLLAKRGATAICPTCGDPVRAKTGEINIWHWAHIYLGDCDPEAPKDSIWRTWWMSNFPESTREVPVTVLGKTRLAAVLSRGLAVEMYDDHVSTTRIREMEIFYDKMIWLFDATAAFIGARFEPRYKGDYYTFRWKHARRSLVEVTRPVYLDLGKYIFWVKKIYLPSAPVGGWGQVITHADFINQVEAGMVPRSLRHTVIPNEDIPAIQRVRNIHDDSWRLVAELRDRYGWN